VCRDGIRRDSLGFNSHQLLLKLIINLFSILGVAEDDAWVRGIVILCLILGLKSLGGHTSESWRGTHLDEPLECEVLEKVILSFNPSDR
jgi:hypothetical protein